MAGLTSMSDDVELILDAHAALGESPTWSAAEQALYWIDIQAPALHRFNPRGGATRTWPLPDVIGCFALYDAQPAALVALRSGVFRLDLHSDALTKLADPPYDPAVFRFNEGACDGRGRFWLGTMYAPQTAGGMPEPGALFCYTSEAGLAAQPDASLTPNGIAWSPDGGTMYFTHTRQHRIFRFDFDVAAGRLGERRLFAEIPDKLGVPDGAAVDEQGGYWCAIHGGSRLARFTPDGKLDREVKLPVSQPTMPAFAGPELEDMYVTSAAAGLGVLHKATEPHAGGLFRLRPGVRGLQRHGFAG